MVVNISNLHFNGNSWIKQYIGPNILGRQITDSNFMFVMLYQTKKLPTMRYTSTVAVFCQDLKGPRKTFPANRKRQIQVDYFWNYETSIYWKNVENNFKVNTDMDILICLCKYNENNRQAKEKIPLNLSNIQTRETWQHPPVAWSRNPLLRLYRWWRG